jgi:hypothetical protein
MPNINGESAGMKPPVDKEFGNHADPPGSCRKSFLHWFSHFCSCNFDLISPDKKLLFPHRDRSLQPFNIDRGLFARSR